MYRSVKEAFRGNLEMIILVRAMAIGEQWIAVATGIPKHFM